MEESDSREFVIAPWGGETNNTEIVTVELPSREIIAQLEVPTHILETTAELSEEYELPLETVLAERLEINMARFHAMIAGTTNNVQRTRENLSQARELLTGVEHLNTTDVEQQIETIWLRELDST